MKILLTNDDGYTAPGILALYETLRSQNEVILIAPDREKSGVSHSITLNDPIRLNQINLTGGHKGYAISGTPADCVKLGLFKFYPSPPDLVISGINPGSNTGVNVNYSGTCGAAREAALNGIKSIAVSIRKTGKMMDFQGIARFVARLTGKIKDYNLPSGTFLNINAPDIPFIEISGIKLTRQANDNVSRRFEKRTDPRNRPYYWYGSIDRIEGAIDTDVNALSHDFISITPIQCDCTDHETMANLASLNIS